MQTVDTAAEATLPYAPEEHPVQAIAPGMSVYEPAVQPAHAVEPKELYEPGAHATHRSDEPAPATLL